MPGTTETETIAGFADGLDELETNLPGSNTHWVRKLREVGYARFQETGIPHSKAELWKHTQPKVAALARRTFQHANRVRPATVTAADLEPYLYGLNGPSIVIVDGRFDPDLSQLEGLPEGVVVDSLGRVLDQEPHRVEDQLGSAAQLVLGFQQQEHGLLFTQLNTALFQDGAVVQVEDGVVVEDPIHVLYVTTAHDPSIASHVRNLIVAGESSEVTVVETYAGLGDAEYLTNVVTEVIAGRNSHVDTVKVQRESPNAYHVAQLQTNQARDSTVRNHNVTFGARFTRNDVHTLFQDEGSHATMNGLFVTRDHQHVDNHTFIDHDAPHCTSHELYKGVLDDESRGVFYGTIFVRKGAQKTDAVQHNPNLLLSDGALVNTTPQLEIFADDVTCTHGSTFGPLEDEQVFYLRSRGMDEETARGLLTYSFAAEALEGIEVPEVRKALDDLLLERLPQAERVQEAL